MGEELSDPPVYYTLVQVQFSPVAAMVNYVNEIQEKLRFDGYTLFDSQKVNQLHFDTSFPSLPPKPEFLEVPIWRITRADRKSGFIVSQSNLTYHTTHYQTHNQFFDEFLLGLEKLHSIVNLDHLSRLGLRYLNAVLPKKEEKIDQYLVNGLHGIKIKATPRYSLNEFVFDTKIDPLQSSGTLVNRILCRSGILGYPPDIAPHDLMPMPKFMQGDNISHAVIDIDHFIEEQMLVNFDQIRIRLSSLHSGIKKTFQATVTDYARKVWGLCE